ncbi:plastid-specific 50S ribosomal protein 5 [Prunus dulcis]|uniref:Plastid-specific 50S ribosomal protein 5 n=1 Tax=Prunus dulcis TaxID=3755 RepID=A0A4Y1QY75_PRUDU|nr:plastid-specific 50S ribosomal protein 5 [Prunus dulcis]
MVSRLHLKPTDAHPNSFSGVRLRMPAVKRFPSVVVKASSDIDGTSPTQSSEPVSDTKKEVVPVDKLPLESKLQERLEQKAKMQLAKKIRLRRKRLVRKRKLRKKGRWPPSKMKKFLRFREKIHNMHSSMVEQHSSFNNDACESTKLYMVGRVVGEGSVFVPLHSNSNLPSPRVEYRFEPSRPSIKGTSTRQPRLLPCRRKTYFRGAKHLPKLPAAKPNLQDMCRHHNDLHKVPH